MQKTHKSKSLLYIGIVAVSVLLVSFTVTAIIIANMPKKESAVSRTSKEATSETVPTKQDIEAGLQSLEAANKQAEIDSAAATAALNDKPNTIRVDG